jgi:hypothetical protein
MGNHSLLIMTSPVAPPLLHGHPLIAMVLYYHYPIVEKFFVQIIQKHHNVLPRLKNTIRFSPVSNL